MKKTSFLVFIGCMLLTMAANAQEYKKFRVGLGFGLGFGSGSRYKAGVLATLEPGYRVNDAILVNLRLEAAYILRGSPEDPKEDALLDGVGINSCTLNGQYYFKNEGFRPFVGAGFGIYSLFFVPNDVSASGSKFGFYPRVGFDAGHFTLCFDYNLIPPVETGFGDDIKTSYLSFRIGAFIGGGRK